ncbi:hypothetical protein L3365_002639 [Salmonella enterica subsp. enterica serovar Kua]|uniref:hypothetical protein n=1 Tax=unclassified Salmonella TaxID=2614656 RepID=UPI00397E98FB|nr:hypothetical protein [Salmonella enterica subsp. enterica serovar Kua]
MSVKPVAIQLATECKQACLDKVCYMEKVIDTYVRSLKLPSGNWCDAVGDKHPYVYITNGNARCSPAEIVTVPDNIAYFDLYTITDDDPHHPKAEKIRILMNVTDYDTFDVTVAGYRVETFRAVGTDEKIADISEFIKNDIIMSLNNSSLVGYKLKDPIYL